MRIAVYGAGGVGGYYGAALARAGHHVVLIARGAHLEAIRQRGLRVRSPAGDFLARPALATADPAEAGPCDAVIASVKSIDLPQVAEQMRPLLGEDTIVVPLLNGVDAHEVLARAAGRGRVGKGLTRIISRVSAPGEVSHEGLEPYVAIAEWDGSPSARTNALVSALREAGVQAEVPPDIDAAALAEVPARLLAGGRLRRMSGNLPGPVRSLPESRELLRRAMEEIASLARAMAVALPDDAVATGMAFVDSVPPDGISSLHRGHRGRTALGAGRLVRRGRAPSRRSRGAGTSSWLRAPRSFGLARRRLADPSTGTAPGCKFPPQPAGTEATMEAGDKLC